MTSYCSRCIMPATMVYLHFDIDGVCDACRSAEAKRSLPWGQRALDFANLCAWAKAESARRDVAYDCVVPVSGGKDSHYQVHVARKFGLRPLLVSFEPTLPTNIGKRNLANLARFADLVQVRKNRDVYAQMCRIAFQEVGDHEWPNHRGIFVAPVREAVMRCIPLMIWGENPQLEYGGPHAAARASSVLDRGWLEEFGGMLGLRIDDFIDNHGMDPRDLALYRYPSMGSDETRSVFLGYYFPWDAAAHAQLVRDQMGFEWRKTPVPGAYWPYENLDCASVVHHDYLRYVKYGWSRCDDHLCAEIRNGRMTREEAVERSRELGGHYPPEDEVRRLCEFLALSREAYDLVVDSYTNPALFAANKAGFLRDGRDLVKKAALA